MIEAIDHVNLVVRDLPKMTAFYRDLLGLTVTKEVSIGGPWVEQTVGLSDVRADVVYLDAPAGGTRIELIAFASPASVPVAGTDRPNAIGWRHLAFRVRDIHAVVETLRKSGIQFFSDVQIVPDSQVTYAGGARKRIVYFKDPEGNLLELCEYRA